jgi:hemerythrin-like domain-containing protein
VPKQGGPLGVMLSEHDAGWEYIGAADGATAAYEGGEQAATRVIAENLRGYVELLREHIRKEEDVLFAMADRVLSAADQRQLGEQFEKLETEVMGPGVHERYHDLLDRAEREMGLA